jgi:hypothetical protein
MLRLPRVICPSHLATVSFLSRAVQVNVRGGRQAAANMFEADTAAVGLLPLGLPGPRSFRVEKAVELPLSTARKGNDV